MQEALPLHLQRRGARGTLYLRRRIPSDVLPSYPAGRKEIWVSLRTTDVKLAMTRLHEEQVRLDGEFLRRRLQMATEANKMPSRQAISSLTDEQICAIGQQWLHQTVASDAMERESGLNDGYFDYLSDSLTESRKVFGEWLAKGRWEPMIDVMREWLPMIGISAVLSPEAERKVCLAMIKAQVSALDYRLARHRGDVVETADKAPPPANHPARMAQAKEATWEAVFESWATWVANRPLSTKKHFDSHWKMLQRFAAGRGIAGPVQVTPKDMADWVTEMAKTVSIVTVNTRLANVKTIFKTAKAREAIPGNPAQNTLPLKIAGRDQGKKAHFPFTPNEMAKIFDSPIFNNLELPRGRSGESAYWMPLILSFTGARAEEIAGLEVEEVAHDPQCGWFFRVTDLPDDDEEVEDLYDEDGRRLKRSLKTKVSRRRVPVAPQLLDLGLLRYVEHIKAGGHKQLFPELKAGNDGKWSSAFGKYFGRYLRKQGVTDKRKVMNSFRHRMKDLLEQGRVDSKYLKRILGHATGDGRVTDGYGDGDLPFGEICREFAKVRFPELLVLPWQPLRKERTPQTLPVRPPLDPHGVTEV